MLGLAFAWLASARPAGHELLPKIRFHTPPSKGCDSDLRTLVLSSVTREREASGKAHPL